MTPNNRPPTNDLLRALTTTQPKANPAFRAKLEAKLSRQFSAQGTPAEDITMQNITQDDQPTPKINAIPLTLAAAALVLLLGLSLLASLYLGGSGNNDGDTALNGPAAVGVIMQEGTREICRPPTNWVRPYMVQPWDSLITIAEISGVDPISIAAANCLSEANPLMAYQSIWLPDSVNLPGGPPPFMVTPDPATQQAVIAQVTSRALTRTPDPIIADDPFFAATALVPPPPTPEPITPLVDDILPATGQTSGFLEIIVRTTPDPEGEVAFTLPTRTVITVTALSDNRQWALIRTEAGAEGWVTGEVITLDGQTSAIQVSIVRQPICVVQPAGDNVSLLPTDGEADTEIIPVPLNTRLEVMGTGTLGQAPYYFVRGIINDVLVRGSVSIAQVEAISGAACPEPVQPPFSVDPTQIIQQATADQITRMTTIPLTQTAIGTENATANAQAFTLHPTAIPQLPFDPNPPDAQTAIAAATQTALSPEQRATIDAAAASRTIMLTNAELTLDAREATFIAGRATAVAGGTAIPTVAPEDIILATPITPPPTLMPIPTAIVPPNAAPTVVSEPLADNTIALTIPFHDGENGELISGDFVDMIVAITQPEVFSRLNAVNPDQDMSPLMLYPARVDRATTPNTIVQRTLTNAEIIAINISAGTITLNVSPQAVNAATIIVEEQIPYVMLRSQATTLNTDGPAYELVPVTSIFVVSRDLNAGDTISSEVLMLAYWPVAAMPEGAYTLETPRAGRLRATTSLHMGEAITTDNTEPIEE